LTPEQFRIMPHDQRAAMQDGESLLMIIARIGLFDHKEYAEFLVGYLLEQAFHHDEEDALCMKILASAIEKISNIAQPESEK